jgi:hypothetical protein
MVGAPINIGAAAWRHARVDENRPIESIPGGDGPAQIQKHGFATS